MIGHFTLKTMPPDFKWHDTNRCCVRKIINYLLQLGFVYLHQTSVYLCRSMIEPSPLLVALHFTPVSHSLGQWVVFGTSVASRLASLGFPKSLQHNQYNSSNNSTRITRITILYGFTSFTSFMRFHISNKFKIFTSFAFSQGLVSSITLSPFSYFGA